MTFDFDITFKLPDLEDPFGENFERIDALYEAGCDDATFGSRGPGFLTGSFTRDGADGDLAVASAVAAVKKAIPGAEVRKIEFW